MRPDTPALLLSANCSIGDKSKHITSDDLYELFMAIGKRKLSALEKYIIEIIQTEAGEEEVQNFQNRYEIPSSQVKALLEFPPPLFFVVFMDYKTIGAMTNPIQT